MKHSLEVEFAAALLEEVFETLTEQVHDHYVVHFAIFGLLVTDKVEEGNKSLSTQFVNEFALPEEHDVSLHLHCFFLKDTTVIRVN